MVAMLVQENHSRAHVLNKCHCERALSERGNLHEMGDCW